MQGVETRLDNIETITTDNSVPDSADAVSDSEQSSSQDMAAAAQATPTTLRSDPATMAAVAARLAEWGLQDEENMGTSKGLPAWGGRARKSGTVT